MTTENSAAKVGTTYDDDKREREVVTTDDDTGKTDCVENTAVIDGSRSSNPNNGKRYSGNTTDIDETRSSDSNNGIREIVVDEPRSSGSNNVNRDGETRTTAFFEPTWPNGEPINFNECIWERECYTEPV